MQVKRMDHAAIRTTKVAETQRFFETVLGLTAGPRPAFDFDGAWLYADGEDVVHLVAADADRVPSTQAALDHVALRIADHDAAIRRLEDLGIPYDARSTPGDELRQIFIFDPNGVRIELNTPGPGAGVIR
jgi:catechol 2,3-dioxygenase-like lactoylglutathione lyase family enzyme